MESCSLARLDRWFIAWLYCCSELRKKIFFFLISVVLNISVLPHVTKELVLASGSMLWSATVQMTRRASHLNRTKRVPGIISRTTFHGFKSIFVSLFSLMSGFVACLIFFYKFHRSFTRGFPSLRRQMSSLQAPFSSLFWRALTR